MEERAIYSLLLTVLMEGRLQPGTKLTEQKLATLLGTTRERVRKVLHRLGHERLLTVVPNRGAFVIDPGFDGARTVYEARRILETGIVQHLAGGLSASAFDLLVRHLAAEREALERGNRFESIRLAGEFHLLLARLTGNELIEGQMQELIGRSAMLVTFFEPESSTICSCDEHRMIVEALRERGAEDARHAVVSHLSLIETRLRPRRPAAETRTLDEVLHEAIAQTARPKKGALRSRKAAHHATP